MKPRKAGRMTEAKKIERVGEPISILDATVQELQLELLRRTKFNALDGEHVAQVLMRHRDLWLAVMLDRQPFWSANHTQLAASWLIKLRDMPCNVWNADCLFIVTDGIEKARELREIATGDDHWGGEVTIYDNPHEVERSLGTGRHPFVVVGVWWD